MSCRTGSPLSPRFTSSFWKSFKHTSVNPSPSRTFMRRSHICSTALQICWRTLNNFFPNLQHMPRLRLQDKLPRTLLCLAICVATLAPIRPCRVNKRHVRSLTDSRQSATLHRLPVLEEMRSVSVAIGKETPKLRYQTLLPLQPIMEIVPRPRMGLYPTR